MFILYSMIAALTTIMVALMGGDIMHISFDTIIYHPDQINTQKIIEYLGLSFLNILSIAIFTNFSIDETPKIASNTKYIYQNLPLKQAIYLTITTIISGATMTNIAIRFATNNPNTIPILIMIVELYFIAICSPIKQIIEFRLDAEDNNTNQVTA